MEMKRWNTKREDPTTDPHGR